VSLDDVKRAIAQKTKTEVDAVLHNGNSEAERIISEAQASIHAKQSAHQAQTQNLLQAMERKEHASMQFARKTILLEEKRKAIDAVFTELSAKLDAMPAPQRADILRSLAQKARDTVQVKRCLCNKKDVAVLSKEFPEAAIIVDDSIRGGFIVANDEGTVRVDFTYYTLIEAVRERNIATLTEKLF
jgi:V/A-type H+/Na+-transporting ATPase subunit E